MLLMALSNEHLLTFNQYKDDKTLFEAIQARFGGNDATKKTQRTLLKQMYENFNAPSTKSLDSIFNSLHAEWNTHVVVWRNKADLDTMSIDYLYNNFKIVEQEVKRRVVSSSSSGSPNMAFLSSPGSTNEADTASIQVGVVSTPVSTVSSPNNTANLSDATVYDFLENQLNGSQLKTGKKVTINRSDTAGYDKTKVECFNCHKMGHFARECRSPRNQENRPRNQDNLRKTVIMEDTPSKAMVAIDEVGFDWSYMADDEVPTNMALMAFSDSEVHNNKTCSNTYLKNFGTLKTQYDNLKIEFNKSEFDLATYKRGLFAPPSIDLSNSGLEEFQQPEFEGYGPKACKSVSVDTSNEIKKAPDAPIIKDWVSESDEDESEEMVLKSDIVQHKPKQANQPMNAKLFKSNISVSAARPINTAASKPIVNVAKPRQNALQTTHSLSRRPFYQQIALKNRNLNNNVNAAKANFVNTAKANSVNTAKVNKVTSAVGNKGLNSVKSSACWVWRPKIKVQDHVFRNSGSYIWCSTRCFKDQGHFDSGCFKHMTKNISYLTDFKKHDGGYVTFGGGAKGGKIIGKGTIRTATKDDTSRILKSFITEIENLVEKKVKIIRFDNRTKFKNRVMNEFCEQKDSKLPTTFWAEAVSTACYVQNRVLVVKPHFKTPYELFKDQLEKFDGKSDEGIFVGYSTTSKAFRVYNIQTRKVEENMHITFLENKPMIAGGGPEWLFDLDALLKLMNYAPVFAGTNSNNFTDNSLFDSSSQASDSHNKDKHGPSQASKSDNHERPNAESSTKTVNTVGPVNTADYPNDPLMPDLEDVGIFDDAYNDRDEGVEADYNNLKTVISVSPIPSTRIHKDHPKEHIIGKVNYAVQTRKMAKQNKAGLISFINKQRRINHKDFQNCLFAYFLSQMKPKKVTRALDNESWVEAMQEELFQFKLLNVWTLVDLPPEKEPLKPNGSIETKEIKEGLLSEIKPGFIDKKKAWTMMKFLLFHLPGFVDPEFPDRVYKVEKTLCGFHQAPRAWPDIMFSVCACSRFQVQPKVSHMHAVKRIFRYLKGQPTLGLSYPKDLPLELIAYFDSDYVGVSLDIKSTIKGCQFLGSRLISWQCKKQTIMANSTTEAEYIAASSCCRLVLWLQN
nr:hypothetical protein [Tanacetum cinerariifolium]